MSVGNPKRSGYPSNRGKTNQIAAVITKLTNLKKENIATH